MDFINAKIKELRIELDMSQGTLARMVGYTSRSSINKIEKGIADVPLKKVPRFAAALGTSPIALMGWYCPQSAEVPEAPQKEA